MTDQSATDVQFGRPFVLVRATDVSGVSGTGIVANGIQWPDGQAAIHWTGSAYPTTTPHPGGMESVTAVHGHGGATRVVWEPNAIPQAEYSSVWPELVGWVQAAHEDGEQIDPAQLLEYLRELKHRALAPAREWMAGIRDTARQAAKTCRCPHPADEHSVYGCADDCACEWMPRRGAARQAAGQDDTGPTVADVTAMLHRMHAAAGLPAPTTEQPDTQQPADAHPPQTGWRVEVWDDGEWMPASVTSRTREAARNRLTVRRGANPDDRFRIVRETTTWTVEADEAAR